MTEDGWRSPFDKEGKCQGFSFYFAYIIYQVNRRYRTIKMGDLDELIGMFTGAKYTSTTFYTINYTK
jgi:hypothetical protein